MLFSDFFKAPRMNRAKQLAKIASMGKSKPKRWCKIHLTARWDEGYRRCVQGHELNQFCQEGEK